MKPVLGVASLSALGVASASTGSLTEMIPLLVSGLLQMLQMFLDYRKSLK